MHPEVLEDTATAKTRPAQPGTCSARVSSSQGGKLVVSGQAAVQRMNVDFALTLSRFVHEALEAFLKLVEAVLVTSERIRAVACAVRVTEIVHELHVLGHRSEV